MTKVRGGGKVSGGTRPGLRKRGLPLAIQTVGTLTAVAPIAAGAVVVELPAPIVTGGTPPYVITYTPASGSSFPVGQTTDLVQVTDSSRVPVTVSAPIVVTVLAVAGGGSGATTAVHAGGDLQAAIDAAAPGDTIVLDAGATYTGNFTLPDKSGASYITLRTATVDANLPGPTTRITPASLGLLPILQAAPGGSPALATLPSAHHWRLLGLAFGPNPGGFGDILDLGDGSSAQNDLAIVPHDLIVDRCYLYGDPTVGQKRAIGLNSASTQILNCYIAGIRTQGQDSQAICGWNGPGPFLITNNYLEAASENVLFGGADPSIANLIPSDITFTNNHCYKPPAWRGLGWDIKNLFELKSAQRVLIDGNLFENVWVEGQAGHALVFTVRNQDGGAPWSTIADVTVRYNVINRAEGAAFNMLGLDDQVPPQTSVRGGAMLIEQNLALQCAFGAFLNSGFIPTTLRHNTFPSFRANSNSKFLQFLALPIPSGQFVCQDNVTAAGDYGIAGDGSTSLGIGALAVWAPDAVFDFNVIEAGLSPVTYPSGNTILAAGALAPLLSSSGAYVGGAAASDGGVPGANVAAIQARMPWASW